MREARAAPKAQAGLLVELAFAANFALGHLLRLRHSSGDFAALTLAELTTDFDSGVEHYRGSFKNKAMFTPLIVSAATLGVSIHGTAYRRKAAHIMRHDLFAGRDHGLIGTCFHIYNVAKKAGGFKPGPARLSKKLIVKE